MTLRLASLAQGRLLRLAWLVPLLTFCTASGAPAQTPPPGGDERPTLTLGPFELRPRLLLNNIGVDNNVRNEAEDPKRDFTFGMQPDLEVTVRPGPLRITYLNSTEFLWFAKYKDERMLNRANTVSTELDLRVLRPFASYSITDTSARPSPEIDVRARRHPRNITAGAALKLATRLFAKGQWAEAREKFDEDQQFRGQELAQTLNSRTEAVDGSIGVELTPVTTVSLVVGRDKLRFASAPLRNADATRVASLIAFSPLGLINGSLSVGYKNFRGLDPSLPDYKGLMTNGTVSVLLKSRYRVETRLTRDVQYSYEEALPYYVLTGGRATVSTQLSDLLDFRVTAGQDRMQYVAFARGDSPGADRVNVYGGGLGFRIGERRRFVIQTEFTERTSDRASERGYKNNRIFGSLTWGA